MEIGHCGYSFHTDGYDETRKAGFDSFLIRLQTEGHAEVTIDTETYTIEQGDIIIVPAHHLYRLIIPSGVPSGDFHLFGKGDWLNHWWNHLTQPFHVKISNVDQITTLWRFLSIELRRPSAEQNQELIEHFFKSICLLIQQEMVAQTALNRPFVVTRMMRYIEEHALGHFTIQHVADDVELSVSRAVHLFKEHTNQTMIGYAQKIRLAAAINQMNYTNMTLEHIAENCGFGNYPYFHRVFKKVYGEAPGRYRRMK
ncbi:helix-turn-helix domain-containing protein [Amphibacillus jilinensis]|uniref:helix-turn-helix domain-containing protein n=1 Tax=Amphibacillus jilinensis TaxID=1216008 RepID=UPI0003059151|nr:AraC family transcriptional regulator [Amphibacillus jilinensis]